MMTMENVALEERIFGYQLLWHYYRGDLGNRSFEDWQGITEILQEQTGLLDNENIKKALRTLQSLKKDDLEDFQYDYNRLFVGPGKMLASPFESSYRNFEKAIMQQETMLVRNFYHFAGVQLVNEGQFPDDHMQFEIEFILHLLGSEEKEHYSTYQLFLEKHLLQWNAQHCEDIFKHSTNSITLAFAYLLKGLLQLEKSLIEGGE